jgi:hypothetical protein
MEYVEGESLYQILRRQGIAVPDAVEIMKQTLSGLQAAQRPKPPPAVTMPVITATKATTVGIAGAIADGLLLRINVHFNFAASPRG